METRQVTQIRIYKLFLRPIMAGFQRKVYSDCFLVAISSSKEKLINWYNEQKAIEPYEVKHPSASENIAPSEYVENLLGEKMKDWTASLKLPPITKYFKNGSPLEWFYALIDEPLNITPRGHLNGKPIYEGLFEEWITKEDFRYKDESLNYWLKNIKTNPRSSYVGNIAKYIRTSIPVPQLIAMDEDFLNEK